MQRGLMDLQMNILASKVGLDVHCVYWENGERKEISGKLGEVIPYDRVSVGDSSLTFVGSSIAIESVDVAGNDIFLCSTVKGYQGCLENDYDSLVKLQETILTKSVEKEKISKREFMDSQMNILASKVGLDVHCIYWENGERKELSGKMGEVVPYDRVSVGDSSLTFVGPSMAIESVDIADYNIYYCRAAQGYRGCLEDDYISLVKLQEAILTRSIKREQLSQRELMDMQMVFLQENIGSNVHCVYWDHEEQKEISGNLSVVYPYDRISVGGKPIPFVGSSIAIERIDIEGNDIFLCPAANGYKGCFENDHFGLVRLQEELLTKSIKLEQLNRVYDSDAPKPQIIEGGRGFKR